MRARTLTMVAITGVLMGGSATAAVGQASPAPRLARAHGELVSAGSAALAKRPDQTDWEQIKAAALDRRIGLAPHRTARFRSLAGAMGLSELETIHPLGPGRCRRALTYLYGNLLDLRDAQPGENWTPLRRLVATEPPIGACDPRGTTPQHA